MSLTVSAIRAARAAWPSSGPCLRCLFQSSTTSNTISRGRSFVSVTPLRPHTLEPQAPPRNRDTPDTSITGGKPAFPDASFPTKRKDVPQAQTSDVSIPEGEAQQSRVVTPASTPSTESASTPSKPQRKSKLRARKAAMTLSPSAITALKDLLAQPEPKMIRVGVKNRGCSGLAYNLEYVEKPGTFDETVEQEGVKVLIDSKALFSIIGSEMDWVEDKLSRRFVFKNPNITEQCGCGESFSIS